MPFQANTSTSIRRKTPNANWLEAGLENTRLLTCRGYQTLCQMTKEFSRTLLQLFKQTVKLRSWVLVWGSMAKLKRELSSKAIPSTTALWIFSLSWKDRNEEEGSRLEIVWCGAVLSADYIPQWILRQEAKGFKDMAWHTTIPTNHWHSVTSPTVNMKLFLSNYRLGQKYTTV